MSNGREIQEFAGIEFANCNACHEDAHQSRFGNDCKQCHTEESFHVIAGRANFDHSVTDFPLRGEHQRIDCASCHTADGDAQNAFKDFEHLDVINCTNCHDDVHESKFGTDCRSCHNEVSFTDVASIDNFDHDLTAFKLEGMHIEVDCRSCHETNMTDPLAHSQCISCHDDYHEGQFEQTNRVAQDCAACHSVEGFEESSFTIEQHNSRSFILEGAHLATPCFSCHLEGDTWQFRAIGVRCVDCHTNVHKGQLDEKFYPEEDCKQCHSADSWVSMHFDHTLTEFDLTGKHKTISCNDCHLRDELQEGVVTQSFTEISSECAACHNDEHYGQFEVDGITECHRCHDPQQWKPSLFDHNDTEFVLEGAHLEVECLGCHKEVTRADVTYIQYKITDFECVSCHQ
jgi:hypothetical protein